MTLHKAMVTWAEKKKKKTAKNVSKAEQDLGWISRALGWGDPYIVNSNERWQNHCFNCAWNRSAFCTFKGQEGLHSAQPHGDTHSTSAILSWWSKDKIAFLSWLCSNSNSTSQAPLTAGWTEKCTNHYRKYRGHFEGMNPSIHPHIFKIITIFS